MLQCNLARTLKPPDVTILETPPAVKNEMQTLLSQKDWSNHPLGPYERWPITLKNSLRIVLESQFPKMIFWGEELYCFYNDAFRPSLGPEKHPSTLGMTYDMAYPEAKHVVLPLLQSVMDTGKSTYVVDQLIPIFRNGQISEAYWTYSHSPLRDEKGTIKGIFVECFETTAARRGQKADEEENRDFRSLSDSISEPVFATNTEGGITYANSSFLEFTGKNFSDLQDFGWNSIIPPEDVDGVMEGWMEAINNNIPYKTEIRYIRHDGEARWFLANVVPVRDANGAIERWVGSATDIHVLKEQEAEKDIFLGMASHELKTPVTSIKGYVQLLQRAYAKSEDKFLVESLTTLNKQVKGLTFLIRDMLDLSRIKTGILELSKEVFSIDELINEVVDELAHVNPEHNFIYKTRCHCHVKADKDRVAQVLVNFLTNAIKYAPDSQDIVITCDGKEDMLRVSVKDKGIGLLPVDRERVFKRFYRTEGQNQVTFPGFGIGLYIASDIVKRHGGTIGVKSKIGKGSTFHFELPILSNS